MRKLITLVLLTVFVGTISLAPAYAADKPGKGDPAAMFKRLDKNNDGKVTKEEFAARGKDGADASKIEKAFARLDKNKDGSLSLEEFSAAPKKKN